MESSADARLFDWLLSNVGAAEVRLSARRLRTRMAPKPAQVAQELGIDRPAEFDPVSKSLH